MHSRQLRVYFWMQQRRLSLAREGESNMTTETQATPVLKTHLNLFVISLSSRRSLYAKLRALCIIDPDNHRLEGDAPEFEDEESQTITCKRCQKLLAELGNSMNQHLWALRTPEMLREQYRDYAVLGFERKRDYYRERVARIAKSLRATADDIEVRCNRTLPAETTLEMLQGMRKGYMEHDRTARLTGEILHELLWMTPNLGTDTLDRAGRELDTCTMVALDIQPFEF